jgi:hypothetical protein
MCIPLDGGVTAWDAGESVDAGDATSPWTPWACRVADEEGGAGPMCTSAGIGTDRSPCTTSENCGSGFECVGTAGGGQPGQCRHYCCGYACDDPSTFCDIRATFDNAELVVPVCMPITPCKLLIDDVACGTDGSCAVVDETQGTTSCVPIGPRTDGEECEYAHCALNLTCLGTPGARKCHKLCHTDSTYNECPAGEVCKGNSTTFKDSLGIGICEKL